MNFLRDDGRKPKAEYINVLVADGGMGDHLCYLVVVDHLLKNVPWVKPFIWVPDYLYDFAKATLPDNANINNFTTGSKHYNAKLGAISTQWNHRHSPMRVHPIDYAAHIMLDIELKPEEKNYLKFDNTKIDLKEFNLPEKYMCISVGMTTYTKALPPELINQIADYIISKGYTPVYLGKEVSEVGGDTGKILAVMAKVDYTKGIDLRNSTTLCQSAAIIAQSSGIVGMEGGLIHLAGFTNSPIIASYTIVSPEQMMPTRNSQKGWNVFPVVPEKSLACGFCQTKTPLLFEANYAKCWYDDYKCIKQLTFDKWKEQIDKALAPKEVCLPESQL